jgi:putative aminopeptidase FrvX
VRYTHTAFETADMRDVAATVALLERFLTTPR